MKAKLSMIVFVIVLGTVLTSALVAVDNFTAPRIARNERTKLQMSILSALGIESTKQDAESVFAANVKSVAGPESGVFRSLSGDYAFAIEGPGLWGPIEGIVALLPVLKTVKGITILRQEETPGLGSRIAEKEYLDTFKGKRLLPKIEMVAAGKAVGDNQVEAITGATLSCRAFEAILNSEIPPLVDKVGRGE